MQREPSWPFVLLVLLLAGWLVYLLAGCVSAPRSTVTSDRQVPALNVPRNHGHGSGTDIDASTRPQTGGVNTQTGDWTGVATNKVEQLSLSLMLLLALDKWLSHRREMARINHRSRE